MNNAKFSLATILFSLIFGTSYTQSTLYKDVQIASPTAASLGKYADVPVSNHTGLPQISVPVYTIKEGPLTVPISLSYHAGGVKVMEPAGWCGIGWALNAGGVISRTVRGIADEALNTSIGIHGHFKDYGFNNYLMDGPPRWVGGGPMPNDFNFATSQFDGEPDLFFFNFNGYSGKFYFQDDRTPVVVGGEDLKIDYYYPMSGSGLEAANIQGFTITTPNGDKYYFGINPGINSGANAVETTFPFSANHQNMTERVYSSWYLTRIESADGLFSINFSYQAEAYSYYTISMYPIDPTAQPSAESQFIDPWTSFFYNIEYQLVKNFIEGVRLSQITFSNGTVDFTPASTARTDLGNSYYNPGASFVDGANTEAKALQSISISNSVGVCKKFQFYYNYFSDNTSPLPGDIAIGNTIQTDRYRLRLDSIREQSCDGNTLIKPYKFEYYGSFLPRRLSFAQDHWGFYNGATSNSTLIPTYSTNTFYFKYGANRDSKWPEMLSGALTKITYPTGGNSSFEFEPHNTYVSTVRYTEVHRGSYSVGYDGSYTSYWNNIPFSGNTYRIVITNGACPNPPVECGASIYIKTTANVQLAMVGTGGNSSNTIYTVIPAGNHKIEMVRSDIGISGTSGAQATIYEIVPTQVSENVIVGGLRIKKIISDDNLGGVNKTETSYGYLYNNGRSTGILYSRPKYVQVIRNELITKFGIAPGNETGNNYPNGCLNSEGGNSFTYLASPCPIIPMATSQGNHIGYNEVTVSQTGNGRSVYGYYGSGTWDEVVADVCVRNANVSVCDPSLPFLPAPPPPFEYKRGEPKYEYHYNENGQFLKTIAYSIFFDSTQIFTPAYMVGYFANFMIGTQYSLRGYWKNRTEKIISDYVPGGPTSQTTNTVYFESPYHHQPTRQTTTNSVGETLESKFKYAADFRISTCDNISSCLADYTSACASCDATLATATAGCSTMGCKYWVYVDNLACRANARAAFVTCRRDNFTNPTNAFKTCLLNAKIAADAQLKPILELQLAFNNPQLEISNWNGSQLLSSAFVKYDFATNPVGKVYPAITQQINLATPSATFTAANTSANNISVTKDNRYQDETTIKVNAGNLSEVTPKTGITTTYLWDYNNNFPIAKTINALNAATAHTSFEADGSGNWTIGSSNRITNDGITGKQSYQLSNGAVTKTGLSSGQSYIVSYWTKNASAFTITGTQGSPAQGKTVSGWTYFEHKVTGITQVSLSGTGLVDELRLYPSQAQMITYTYNPLLGMTSECDVNNTISYYEYDGLSRLILIRDQDKNVIKTIDYKYGSIAP